MSEQEQPTVAPSAGLLRMADFLQAEVDTQASIMGDELDSVDLEPADVRLIIAHLRAVGEWLAKAGV